MEEPKLLGKVESFSDCIRVYDGNFGDKIFRRYHLEPNTTVQGLIEIILSDKGIVFGPKLSSEFCFVECDQKYNIQKVFSGSETPVPSMSNLETYEEGSFLLRKGSLVQSIQHQQSLENSLKKEVSSFEEAQKIVEELISRMSPDVDQQALNTLISDIRSISQGEEGVAFKESSTYPDFLEIITELCTTSEEARQNELKNAKFDTESRKERDLMKRRTTTKLTNFFGVSGREAQVATIRRRIKSINLDDEFLLFENTPQKQDNGDDDDDILDEETNEKNLAINRERQRTVKLASFFGVHNSEVEIRELRKMLEYIDSEDSRDSSDVEQFDNFAKKGRSQSTLNISAFLKKRLVAENPSFYQVRSTLDLEDIGKRFKATIRLINIRLRFRTYYQCFSGREAVEWFLVNSIEATTIGRQEAIAIGNLLFQKGLFHHILKKHAFDDKNLFYQFTESAEEEKKAEEKKVDEEVVEEIKAIEIPINTIRKEGWLLRFEQKKKEWKKYWCSVENMVLKIQSEPPVEHDRKDKTAKKEVVSVKVLHLEGCVIVPCDLKKHSFEIKTLDNKSAIFAVDSLEQTVLWINALKIASRIHPIDNLDGNNVTLDDFEFLKVIGKGTSGKVLLCIEKRTGIVYAMKILKKGDVSGPKHLKGARIENRILRELQHPFVVKLHYAFQSDDRLYLVMDYLSGGELFHHICEEGAFTEARACFYAAEILLALQYLHSCGILYRDLKLENIMMDKDGHIKITDFGMCKDELQAGMKTNTICGTSEYLPPEIILRTRYGVSVDWWTFGVVLFEMLCGEHPFYSEDKETLYTNILYKEIEFPHYLSENAKSLLKGLLERDPEFRLGCEESRDGQDIQNHPFFASIDWNKLLRGELPPPYIPKIETVADVSYFDPSFTNEPVILTPVTNGSVFEQNFDGFSFVGENAFHMN